MNAVGKSFRLNITARRELTSSVAEFTLADDSEGLLPAFLPGSHISVETPSGAVRRYSLVNDGRAPTKYVIAVKKEANSRGGSASMHDEADAGTSLSLTAPQNEFELKDAAKYLLIAGGIGITPIIAMANFLHETQKPFRLIYCTRTRDEAAYLGDIESRFADHTTVHHDGGDPAKIYDFWDDLEKPDNSRIYCCGPAPLMEDVKGMTGHWPEGRVHFEDFKPVEVVRADDRPFAVTISSRNRTIEVPGDRSILEALRDAGLKTVSSCESGTCGTCKTKLVSGNVEHRDMVLEESEKPSHIMICVSRAKDGDLVIDL